MYKNVMFFPEMEKQNNVTLFNITVFYESIYYSSGFALHRQLMDFKMIDFGTR